MVWKWADGTWTAHGGGGGGDAVGVGEDVAVQSLNRFSDADDRVYLWRDGYLRVDALDVADASDLSKSETIKTKPGFFDAAGLVVEQHFAISADGTKVPYFVQRRADAPADGSTPTLLDASRARAETARVGPPRSRGGFGRGWSFDKSRRRRG